MGEDFDLRLLASLSATESRSGEALARALGCTRAAVWKHIESLRALGIGVEAAAGLGYRLTEPVELLDGQRIEAGLAPSARRALVALRILKSVDSTNAELQRLATGRQHGQAVLVEHQAAGRGRRGRGWFSPFARNVYLSLGWRFDVGVAELGCLPLVVALAAAEALRETGVPGVGIKWPNDLVLDGAKLGGCLVELQGDASGPCSAVMGVGINVRMGDSTAGADTIDQAWTDIARQHPAVSRNELAARLLENLLESVEAYGASGFGNFARRWTALDVLAGRPVVLDYGSEPVTGIAAGISERGGLLVNAGGAQREFLSGEVSARPAG